MTATSKMQSWLNEYASAEEKRDYDRMATAARELKKLINIAIVAATLRLEND